MPNDVNTGPNSAQARAERDATLDGPVVPAPEGVIVQPLDATGQAELPPADPGVPTVADPNNVSISDEQDFDAVADRESIESDAERIKKNREQYQVIEPGDLPKRTNAGPNICLLYTSPSPRDKRQSRMPSSA